MTDCASPANDDTIEEWPTKCGSFRRTEGASRRSAPNFPELPGCVSQGETEEEALENVGEAIRLYLEAREEPLARQGGTLREVEPKQVATESVFVDEDELPMLAAGLRTIVSEATPASEVDFGDLGKEKGRTTVKVTSVEGAAFTDDESLVGDYVVRIGGRGFQAVKPEVFATLADRMERAAALLKKIVPDKQNPKAP